MKKLIFALAVFGLLALPKISATTTDTNPPPRLTVELRDGSRVTGNSLDETWNFRSATLGELKLAVTGIRAVEMGGGTNENARVTTAGGDVLDVQFTTSAVRVETGFGKTELSVNLIRSLKISTRGDTKKSSGDWWSAEEDAKNSVEENLRSHSLRWIPTGGQITVGAFVQDTLEDRQGQPPGRGAIARVVSVTTDEYGRPAATVNFGRGYTAGIFFTELTVVRVFPASAPPKVSAKVISTNENDFRLTVELRDGSRVVGENVEKQWTFRSALLGEIKLDVKDIRAVDCVATNSAKLTAANGDTLIVAFAAPAFAVKTVFGKVDLQAGAVRKISVSGGGLGAYPAGLVALWSGEGSGKDAAGGNHGELQGGAGYAPGKVGQAFALRAVGDVLTAPTANLPAGAEDRTITCWVNVTSFIPGAEASIAGYGNFGSGGQVFAIYFDNRPEHQLSFSAWGGALAGPSVDTGRWHFVAVTSKANLVTLYLDGVKVASRTMTFDTPAGTVFRIGQIDQPDCLRQFNGLIDEVAIYNRALSAEEIQTICQDQNDGELPPPPAVQPRRSFNRFSPQGFID